MEAAETDRLWHRLRKDGDSRRLFLLSLSFSLIFLGCFFLIGSTQLSSFSDHVGQWRKVAGKVEAREVVTRTFARGKEDALEVMSVKMRISFTVQDQNRAMTFLLPVAGETREEAEEVANRYPVGSEVPLRVHPDYPERVLVNVENSLTRTRRMGDVGFLLLGVGILLGGATLLGLLSPSWSRGGGG